MKVIVKKRSTYVTKSHFDKTTELMGKRFDAFQKYLEFRLDPIEQAQKDNEKFKQSVLKSLDWLVGAFKKFDEEHTILSEGYFGCTGKN